MVTDAIYLKRDILNGISSRRIDPTRIKFTESPPETRGGQGIVVLGSLLPPQEAQMNPLAKDLEDAFAEGSNKLDNESFEEARSKYFPNLTLEEFKKLMYENIKTELIDERKVAVKKLAWPRDDAERSNKFFKSFVNELSLMASLAHPNIIKFLGFVEDEKKGDAWIILPWEENGNVRQFLQYGEWDIPERVSLVRDTARGLQYLHAHDPPICHGDLKSLNILVNSSYRAVITDFGSARVRPKLEPETQSNIFGQAPINDGITESTSPHVKFSASTGDLTLTGPKFSLRWTAPEVLDDGLQDLPSDMWAIGWISWEVKSSTVV
ncbi:hypothetical protein FS837_000422 [Tulasnella sp. UAMH 9824]|nr:hypothetical protein FS837_000422 [Tulasnella sp. UAMH 9824]